MGNDGNARIIRLSDGLHDARSIGGKQDDRPSAVADRLVELVDLHIAVVLRVEELDLDAVRLCLRRKGILDLRTESVAVIIIRIDDAIRIAPCQPAAEKPKTGSRQE